MDIRLAIIDDNPADLLRFTRIIKQSYMNPHVTVHLATMTEPPSNIEALLSYDGLLLDERMGKYSGIDVAQDVHRLDWTVPIMILSGLPPTAEAFNNCLAYVDYVVSKDFEGHFLQTFTAFVRQIHRVRFKQLQQNTA